MTNIKTKTKTIKNITQNKPLIGLIIFCIIVSMLNPRFLSWINMLNVLRQTSVNSIIATGMTLVILTGGIDLSVGSVLAFTGAVLATLISSGMSTGLAVIIALGIGAVFGIINGLFIAKAKLQPFIVTLVTMTLVRGATMIFTDGKPIPVRTDSDLFFDIGGGYLFEIPVPIYIMLAIFAVIYYVLSSTKFGRYIFAIGGNEDATRLSGINTDKIKVWVYGLGGFFAALAGVVVTSRLGSAQPTAGTGYELDAIAAVVVGGTSLSGGIGSITGTLLGAVIIGVLGNALNLLNVSSYYQLIVKSLVILVAVLIDKKSKK